MREDTFVAFVADSFVVKSAYTVVVVSACFAFTAFSLKTILAEQFRICHCLATWRWAARPITTFACVAS